MSGMVVNLRNPAIVPAPTEEWIDRQPHLFSGYFDEVDGYRRHRTHGNETCLLFYTISGAGFMRGQNGTLTRALPGDLHVYRPDVWHDYGTYPGGKWGFHWIHFRPRPTWAELLRLNPVDDITGLVHAHIHSPKVNGRITEALRRIHRDTAMDTTWRSELAMNAIEYILLLTGEASGLGRRPLDPRIQQTLEHIATHPDDDLSVDQLARSANLSPSRFAHLFKDETGQTPQRFVAEARLREAAKLIEVTSMPITDVAAAVGFRSTFHFSTTFRARYEMSPTAYRKRHTRTISTGG